MIIGLLCPTAVDGDNVSGRGSSNAVGTEASTTQPQGLDTQELSSVGDSYDSGTISLLEYQLIVKIMTGRNLPDEDEVAAENEQPVCASTAPLCTDIGFTRGDVRVVWTSMLRV